MDHRLRYLNGLRYFEAAARLKSYSRAAEELCVSQAAVSQKLRQLEEQLRCKLFYRKGREMQLSSEGKRLYDQVSHGFQHIVSGLNAINTEPLNGILNVNTTPSFAAKWLMPRLWRFSVEHPDIPIRVNSTVNMLSILENDADLAIGEQNLPTNNPDHYQCEVLMEEPIYPVCSPELVKNMNITQPKDLLDCWFVKGVHNHHFSWESWFNKAKVQHDDLALQWIEVSTLDMGLNAVIAGHGVCPGTDSLTKDFIERGLLVKPFNIELTPGIKSAAVYNQNSARIARITVFIEWLKREIAS